MVGKRLAFIGAYFRANLAVMLEYRASTLSQLIGMFLNNGLWVAFWILYFTRFPVLRGWTLEDVIVLWAVITTSYGLSYGLTGNALRIPQLIVQGQLDYYMALPKNVLLHLLVSQIRLINLGDLIFGPLLMLLMVRLTWTKLLIFIVASILSALIQLGFLILVGSLTFFLGNADALSTQMVNALLHFSTYPTTIFDQGVRLILFTLIPAGFVSTLPVELVRQFSWSGFALLAGAAVFFLGIGTWLFHRGLRRYESGNLVMMRS